MLIIVVPGAGTCGTEKPNTLFVSEKALQGRLILTLTAGAKTVFIAKVWWISASSFIRLSLLSFFYRLLDHVEVVHRGFYRMVLHATTFFVVSIYLSYLGIIVWACDVPSNYFLWPSPGHCIQEGYADTIMSGFNTTSEFLVAALPIPVIMSLRMNKMQRRTVVSLLCLGFLVGVVGIVRSYYVWTLFQSDDLTWWAGPHWICSEVEICVAMVCFVCLYIIIYWTNHAQICASAPSLRPYLGRVLFHEKPTRAAVVKSPNKLQKPRSSAESKRSGTQTTAMDSAWETATRWHFDLEGIGVDGFGYTVTVTGGPEGPKRRKLTNHCIRIPRNLKSGTKGAPTWNLGNSIKRLVRHPARDSDANLSEKGNVEIITRKSLELRESFCEDGANKYYWDQRNRNPYARAHLSDGGTSDRHYSSFTFGDTNFFHDDSELEDDGERDFYDLRMR